MIIEDLVEALFVLLGKEDIVSFKLIDLPLQAPVNDILEQVSLGALSKEREYFVDGRRFSYAQSKSALHTTRSASRNSPVFSRITPVAVLPSALCTMEETGLL
jgi:hypothetical protein